MIESRLSNLWNQLQGKKPHLPHFLSEVNVSNIRGIDNLRIYFDYPVSVLAGANGSGKTTVLFASACAYSVPNSGIRDFYPSTLFPDYYPKGGKFRDERSEASIQFDYSTPSGRMAMLWKRSKGWNRSFLGRTKASQPERQVYLRTLSNLSNPSEVRGVLSMSRLKSPPKENLMNAAQVDFAHQVLPFQYKQVIDLSSGRKNLLFAEQVGGATYSELHMASGERTVLRLSQEIAQLKNALVLIDEVEAGLHPWVQQLLMLQLQQVSLRNNLQIIVTTHSPTVLDCVPNYARLFLDRDANGCVSVVPAYRDVVQNILYGRFQDSLNMLCEDDAAEGIIRGVLDVLLPQEGVRFESVRIGRNTGADEFPTHAAAFRKFGQIKRSIFILDGDRFDAELVRKIRRKAEWNVPVLSLPSSGSPETWVWRTLADHGEKFSASLGIESRELSNQIQKTDSVFDSASDSESSIFEHKIGNLCRFLKQTVPALCRVVARLDVASADSELRPLMNGLHDALMKWRQTGEVAS